MILHLLKHAFTFFFIMVPLMITGWLLLPFVLLFTPKDREYLPYYVRWFDNHDYHFPQNSGAFIDGLAGSPHHRLSNGLTSDSPWHKLLWERYVWLGWRNPVNYFQYKHLGVKIKENKMLDYDWSYTGYPNIERINNKNGFYKLYFRNKYTGKKGFEYYRVMSVPFFSDTHYFRIRFGWKIRSPLDRKAGDVQQWVFFPPWPRKRID